MFEVLNTEYSVAKENGVKFVNRLFIAYTNVV